jgi:UDP-glucose 4-epimerase
MIQDFAKAYQIPFAILRYFNASGASLDGVIGELHEEENHLIPLAIQALLKQREHLDIFGSNFATLDGTAIRDFIHVEDLAHYHLLTLKHLLNKQDNLILNLGTGQGTSVKQIIDTLENISRSSLKTQIKPPRAGDPQELVANAEKSFETFNFKPRYSSIEMICHTALNWHKGNL